MFSARALESLSSRSRSSRRYWRFAADCLREARANARERRALTTNIVRFVMAVHAAVAVFLTTLYVAARWPGLDYALIWCVLSAGAVTVLLTLHVGLIRRCGGAPCNRLGLANKLTILRFVLVCPAVLLTLQERWLAALAVYGVCVLTDVLDGVVARHQQDHTDFGVIMDPVADIVSTTGIFAALLAKGLIPGWVFGILIVRYVSLAIGCIAIFFTTGPIPFKATVPGKIVGVLQALAAILVLVLAAADWQWSLQARNALSAFLGTIFGVVIVSQVTLAIRYSRKGAVHAGP